MKVRFSSVPYRSFLRFFWPGYNDDKKTILRTTRATTLSEKILDDLSEALEIVRLKNYLDANQPQPNSLFGIYDQRADTDFEKIHQAIEIAKEVLGIVGSGSTMTPEMVKVLSAGSPPALHLEAIGKRLFANLTKLRQIVLPVSSIIPHEFFSQAGIELFKTPLVAVEDWLKQTILQFTRFTEMMDCLLPLCRSTSNFTIQNLISALEKKDRLENIRLDLNAKFESLREKFGQDYCGIETNWKVVLKAIEWTANAFQLFEGQPVPQLFVELAIQKNNANHLFTDFARQLENVNTSLENVMSGFGKPGVMIAGRPLTDLPLAEILIHLKKMSDELPQLELWVDLQNLNWQIKETWIERFLNKAKQLQIPPGKLVQTSQRTILEYWISQIRETDTDLKEFRSGDHNQYIQKFKELDRRLIHRAARRVIEEVEKHRPQGFQVQSSDSETGILQQEAKKQRRHRPVRALFNEIPNLVMKLKPCLLMSPLSVSQFLQTERIKFDLVIFDEASQIFTEDAIGAIIRSKQIVIAGDSKQLPPTDFFRRISADDDSEFSEEDDIDSSTNYASVLDEFQTIPGVQEQYLRWHYRSRHESLIAFSNNRFYDNRLVTFPSAKEKSPALGVEFFHVKDGIYDRGGKRINAREAQVVVSKVFDHFRLFPKKSLIVVTFSQAQQQAIEDELERQLRQTLGFEEFFKEDRLEGFEVKNLENVQGDERDVVIFSVGYGKDAYGKMTMGFGPLNRNGGERRLNVAITRAREKVILVSSITASDIKTTPTSASGVLHFQRYLDYAERGTVALSLTHPQGLGEAESPLEADIASEIRNLGYEVIPQVGCSGYRIDMGVIDPEFPGQFLLGVEADGATYHSAHTARDRDRLRQRILEDLGWTIHRIWSFDWFDNRTREIERLHEAIKQARIICPNSETELFDVQESSELPQIQVIERLSDNETLPGTINYVMCPLPLPQTIYLAFHHDLCRYEQTNLLEMVVMQEGPIHIDLAARRLAKAWNLEKVGKRMREAIDQCVRQSIRRGQIYQKSEFLYPMSFSAEELQVRLPVEDEIESQRKIEHIAPEELQKAMLILVEHAQSLRPDSLIAETRKLFGFNRTGISIQQRLQEELDKLLESQHIIWHENKLFLPTK